jgi:hypothetical protein
MFFIGFILGVLSTFLWASVMTPDSIKDKIYELAKEDKT